MRHMQNTHEGVEQIASRTWASALACFGSFPSALGFLLFIVVFRPQQSCLLQPTYPSTLEVARPESGDCVGAELGVFSLGNSGCESATTQTSCGRRRATPKTALIQFLTDQVVPKMVPESAPLVERFAPQNTQTHQKRGGVFRARF